jgi:hypothetical protein
MRVIDDHGRLFGRVNLFDVIVGAVCLGLSVLAFGAFLLFRMPVPQITSVEPSTVMVQDMANNVVAVRIIGEDLRPFLRARLGAVEADFLVQSPRFAEIKLPQLPAGTYDLVLYDESQELVRLAGALNIVAPASAPPPALVKVQAVGKFSLLTEEQPSRIAAGARYTAGGVGEALVVAALAPEPAMGQVKVGPSSVVNTPIDGRVQVPAILQVKCEPTTDGCRLGAAFVDRTMVLSLTSADEGDEILEFVVEEVRGANAPLEFPVRLPSPVSAVLQAIGVFEALDEAQAEAFKVGTRFGVVGMAPVAEIVALESVRRVGQRVRVGLSPIVTTPAADTVQLPATLRLRCTVAIDGCRVGDATVGRNIPIALPVGGRMVRFVVQEVRAVGSETQVAEMLVRFVVRPEVFELLKVGDADQPAWIGGEGRAVLTAIEDTKEVQAVMYLGMNPDPNRPVQGFEQDAVAFEAAVRVPVQGTASGWQYQGCADEDWQHLLVRDQPLHNARLGASDRAARLESVELSGSPGLCLSGCRVQPTVCSRT